jgi:peroxiredoxin
MAQFEPFKTEIERAGAQLVFVAAEKRHGIFKPAKSLAKHRVSFPFLLDEDRTMTKAYGLYHRLGHDAIHIARPATLVIDHAGVVRFIYRGVNQNDRIPVTTVLEALKKT